MTKTAQPDLFSNVHKGIRRALFAACEQLGRAEGDPARERGARAVLAEALQFVAHHGENEDLLILPLLRERAPQVFARMAAAHAELDEARAALMLPQPIAPLYLAACAFTSQYLAHRGDEEREFEPAIRAALSVDEAIAFGRGSIERTSPVDQRRMLGWMLPAMTRADATALLGRLPVSLADELRSAIAGFFGSAAPAPLE